MRSAAAEALGTALLRRARALARGFTATFAGIGPGNVPAFIAAQVAGAGLAVLADRLLRPNA